MKTKNMSFSFQMALTLVISSLILVHSQHAAISIIEAISPSHLEKIIKEQQKPLVIDFYSDSCGPCKTMAPIFNNYADKYCSHITFIKANTSKNHNFIEHYKIRNLPCFLLLDKTGKEIKKIIGSDSVALETAIKKL